MAISSNDQWYVWVSLIGAVASILSALVLVPVAIFWLRSRYSSTCFVVAGATGVGKTSLLRVLAGRLPNLNHIKTVGFDEVHRVNMHLGGTENLRFSARIVHEIGGEFSRNLAATLVDMNPHGLILIFDGTSGDEEKVVAFDIAKALNALYQSKSVASIRLKAILVIVNKYDLATAVTAEAVRQGFVNEYGSVIDFFRNRSANVHVNICVGSLTERQFFLPIEEGMRFLVRATKG